MKKEITKSEYAQILGTGDEVKTYEIKYSTAQNKKVWKDGKYIITFKADYTGYSRVIIEYYKNNKKHREDGPAQIDFYESDGMGFCYYFINGRRHCLNGTSLKVIDKENGNYSIQELDSSDCSEYWINGKHYSSKEEYETAVYIINNNLETYN